MITVKFPTLTESHGDVVATSKVPFLSKQVPAGAKEVDLTVVGGTVAWNQLAPDYTGQSTAADVTITQNSDGSYTLNGTASATSYFWIYSNVSTPASFIKPSHKYLCTSQTSDTTKARLQFILYGSPAFVWNEDTRKILSAPADIGNYTSFGFVIQILTGSHFDNFKLSVTLTDLTQMFGSTLADYIYTLESGTAGAGIALLKTWGFFTKDYYDYDAGTLMSVKTSAHEFVGKNLLDTSATEASSSASSIAEMFQHYLSTGEYGKGYTSNGSTIASNAQFWTSFTPCIGGLTYTVSNTADTFTSVCFLDASGNVTTVSTAWLRKYTHTATMNECYIMVGWKKANADTMQIELGAEQTEHETYHATSYPLDDIELRGIPKKDADNNLYYDGDTYESDGTVTRKYGTLALSTLSWSEGDDNGTTKRIRARVTPNSYQNDMICDKLTATPVTSFTDRNVGEITYIPNNYYQFDYKALSSMTLAQWGTLIADANVVIKLGTETTETADPYENPQDVGTVETFTDTRDVPIPVGVDETYYEVSEGEVLTVFFPTEV